MITPNTGTDFPAGTAIVPLKSFGTKAPEGLPLNSGNSQEPGLLTRELGATLQSGILRVLGRGAWAMPGASSISTGRDS